MAMQVNDGLEIYYNHKFLKKAEDLNPTLITTDVYPVQTVKIIDDPAIFQGVGTEIDRAKFTETDLMGKDDEVVIDFGTHIVGYVEFDIIPVGSPPDAPLLFDMHFAEMPVEFLGTLENYNGWISKSWLQIERKNIDYPECHYTDDRRYSFRYLKIKVLDTSQKYKVKFKNFKVTTVSAVENCEFNVSANKNLNRIGKVSAKTLRNCMQNVYEDGPKRDRRLWLGDLYIQALANYYSFNDVKLLKRCLYLFAGTVDSELRVAANLFIKPKIIPDDTYLVDYSMHFINTLADFCRYSNDLETGQELYQTAKNQIQFALKYIDEKDLFIEQDYWWAFFDWNDELKKSTAMHGLFLYTLKNMNYLANLFDTEYCGECNKLVKRFKYSAEKFLFNKDKKLYKAEEQYSMHSQIWMVLAEVGSIEQRKAILKNILANSLDVKLITPYAQHFFVEALFSVGLREEAKQIIIEYWGKMVDYGADTFWELFDPDDLETSPYGSQLANSYCHAWSCTPIYFINKYNL